MLKLSIIIPVWNEEKNIYQLISRIHIAMQKEKTQYEIIFIDDRSSDKTISTISHFKTKYPIRVFKKIGKRGKAQSLVEGFEKAQYPILAMIDADLQYPPEALPLMLEKIEKGADIIVAKRKGYKTSRIRSFVSVAFKTFFAKVLFNLNHDVQTGLKMFKRDVYDVVRFVPTTGWAFDLEFLHRARHAGFVIEDHEIIFEKRLNGKSKVSFLSTSFEIGLNALNLRLKPMIPLHLPSTEKDSMRGAGVGYKRRKYITHSTLHHGQSALITITNSQRFTILAIFLVLLISLILKPLQTGIAIVGILSFIYFIDTIFNFFLVMKSLHAPQEITSTIDEIKELDARTLPIYSILCPLYKEAHVIPQFLEAIEKIDYPKNKLDVLLILEEDDKESVEKVKNMQLPGYVTLIVVPHSMPKTKPKACNYGLSFAKGDYLVIYDAEDVPDPLQLKKAYLGFQKVSKNVLCLQAKLNYYNPHQNILTKFFTAEYSLWFDVILTGLQAANTSIPLGGTSNHFRVKDLKNLEGWDPFNVTEDADLGIRLFKRGYKTAIIDSVTLEEANSNVYNWIRQRSRWIKGYMQTYLVHTRDNWSFLQKNFYHALLFHLNIGGKIAFILINPILWAATISYFVLYRFVGSAIESLYPSYIFYMALFSLVFGNFMFIYYYMIGCAKREQWSLIKYVYFIPIYWLLISWSGFVALFQLIFKPHYWEKTIHGLYLRKVVKKVLPEMIIETEEKSTGLTFPTKFRNAFIDLIQKRKTLFSGGSLITATIIVNFLNFLFNIVLGRIQNLEDFGLLSLVSSLTYFSSIPTSALSTTVNYRSGFLDTRYGKNLSQTFWGVTRKRAFVIGVILSAIFLILSPLLKTYFKLDESIPFILFAFVWITGFVASVDRGYLFGKLLFGLMAVLLLTEAVLKIFMAYIFVQLHHTEYAYTALIFPYMITFFIGWFFLVKNKKKQEIHEENIKNTISFPKKFYFASLLSGLSTIGFFSLDIVLAKHFLSPTDAGRYALISLVGKIIYFLGSLANQFIVPFVSRGEGERKNTLQTLNITLIWSAILAISGFAIFGLFGSITLPLILGNKVISITQYVLVFGFAMTCFTLSRVFVTYYLAKKVYSFSVVSFILTFVQFILIYIYHDSLSSIVFDMTIIGVLNLLCAVLFHIRIHQVKTFENNFMDLVGLFSKMKNEKKSKNQFKILVFNWRDKKHKWGGGAEIYIHELSKRWVQNENHVTVFCGSDHHSPRNEVIEGVQYVRRGGFYTVYIWAFLYYVLRFRGLYDVIVDSENGIPFFTPLFVKKPIFLLIHHVHQEVFRQHLSLPAALLAQFLESKMMPIIYKNQRTITVSKSSKREIENIGLKNIVAVINPGIEFTNFFKSEKTRFPSFVYLGRLMPYKNIDIAIKAFSEVVKKFKTAKFFIVGFGESSKNLQKLVKELHLEDSIQFLGIISEEAKHKILAESWALIHPSMIEGWGITVIEANASGTPVIASNVNGLKDSIVNGKTGLLIEAKSVKDFEDAMLLFINDKNMKENLSEEAFKWSKNFSWDKSASEFFQKISETQASTISGKLAYQ